MIVQMSLAFSSLAGTPFCSRIWIASWIHCCTLPGGGLDGGPPLGPRPPPPPAWPPPPTPPPPPPPPPPWCDDGEVVGGGGGADSTGTFSDENLGLKPLAALPISLAAVPSAVLMVLIWLAIAPLLSDTAELAADSVSAGVGCGGVVP